MTDQTTTRGKVSSSAIETLGVDPVPLASRKMGPGMLFLIWALASASATTPVIGLLLDHLGLLTFSALVLIASLIGFLPALLFAHMGRQVPVISMVMARRTWGFLGAGVLALLYTVVGAGWFGLNTDVGGKILSNLFPGLGWTWYLLLGLAQIGLVFFGMELLEKFYKYTALLFLSCYAVLTYYLLSRYPLQLPVTTGIVPWGKDIDLILSFSLLAWSYDFPTVSRFCVPYHKQESRNYSLFFASMPTLGVMTAVLFMGILGLVTLRMTGDWNVAMLGRSLPLWGEISAIGVILAIAHTNAMNLYPAVTKFLAVINVAERDMPNWLQPIAVLGLGVLATALAIAGILHVIEGFLNVLGELLFPFSFLLITDWFYQKHYQESPTVFYRGSETKALSSPWSIAWASTVLIGAILFEVAKPWPDNRWASYVPWQVLSAATAAFTYVCGMAILRRTALGKSARGATQNA
ncbi:purine-cytosine permease family protein [Acidithiobacillus caldus]|uniref:purine-cytosine permease family protein n=1 Tax=Acidithiobacillus caldus TaxID=33059 RepID=UPI0007D8E17A|nr:cytosine permease [Acidithiobacillus caldus]QER45886.1 permease for cytosine/purine, uracil, thiamine, allantoin [Acidithiobacillus caldus]